MKGEKERKQTRMKGNEKKANACMRMSVKERERERK